MNPSHAAGIASHIFENIGILFQFSAIHGASGIFLGTEISGSRSGRSGDSTPGLDLL